MEESLIKKIVDGALVVLSLIVAVAFYYAFDLENIFYEKQLKTVSQADIEANRALDYSGKKAGEGIKTVKTKEEWEDTFVTEYITITPVKITKTNVYSLANWVDHYTKRRTGGQGRRRNEVQKEPFDYDNNYRRYYVIELEDGTNILAQMNRGIANKIAKGEKITLPLGRKTGLTNTAKKMLSDIIEEKNITDTYVLYTIDDEWQKSNSNKIFFIKFGASAVLCLAIATIALTIVDKRVFKEED